MSEFVSDAFDSTAINQEDLRKEMEQLVLDKKDSPSPDGWLWKSSYPFFFSLKYVLFCKRMALLIIFPPSISRRISRLGKGAAARTSGV